MCDDPHNDTNPPDQFISVELGIKPAYTQVSSGKFIPSDKYWLREKVIASHGSAVSGFPAHGI